LLSDIYLFTSDLLHSRYAVEDYLEYLLELRERAEKLYRERKSIEEIVVALSQLRVGERLMPDSRLPLSIPFWSDLNYEAF
jgi:hypothetical protein